MTGSHAVRVNAYRNLVSELATLDSLIAMTPVENVIDRSSLESRKEQVETEIAGYSESQTEGSPAYLVFRGDPVKGDEGIIANFCAEAIDRFHTAVTTVGAGKHHGLGERGVIPNSDFYQLMVTDIVRGSFGFQIESATQRARLGSVFDPASDAIDEFKSIIRASTSGDDDLADVLADTEIRAVNAVRRFLEVLEKHDAVCSIEFKGDEFRFEDPLQVRRSIQRLRKDNIVEKVINLPGQFIGYLPESRRAEFLADRITGDIEDVRPEFPGGVINAKIDRRVEDTDQINEILNLPTQITVRVKRVGKGKPSFVILQI